MKNFTKFLRLVVLCYCILSSITTAAESKKKRLPPHLDPAVREEIDKRLEKFDLTELKIIKKLQHKCLRKTRKGDTVKIDPYLAAFLDPETKKEKMFDNSRLTKHPMMLVLGQGNWIPGLEQGLLDMCAGDKRMIGIPSEMAFGPVGFKQTPLQVPIPPNADLIFDVELLEFSQTAGSNNDLKYLGNKHKVYTQKDNGNMIRISQGHLMEMQHSPKYQNKPIEEMSKGEEL